MSEFFEKTWLVWWIIATLIVLRWFHIISSGAGFETDGECKDIETVGSQQLGSSRP